MLDEMNNAKIVEKFTEIVALRLDVFDQMLSGVHPINIDTERYKRRYVGTPRDQLPPYTVEINHFKMEVDYFVSMLMIAINEEDSICQQTQ